MASDNDTQSDDENIPNIPRENGQNPETTSRDVKMTLLTNRNKGKLEEIPEVDEEEQDEASMPCFCSQRWILSCMGFCFGFVLMTVRMNMSLTLPYMVKTVYKDDIIIYNTTYNESLSNITLNEFVSNATLNKFLSIANTTLKEELNEVNGRCGGSRQQDTSSKNAASAEFEWNKFVQSLILAGYFWGYIVTQVPGGLIAGKFGGKRVITVAMSTSAVLTLLTPVLARASPYAVIAERFLLGLMSGFCMPSMFNLMGVWALPNERSRMVGMILFGIGSGTVFGIISSGILCDKGFDNGWGSVYYVHGSMTALFVIAWIYNVSDSPMNHPRITDAEKRLLQKYIIIKDNRSKEMKEKIRIPWKKILTYVPVYVICFTHGISNLTNYLLSLCLPLFLKETMNFDMQSNGFYSSLPFLFNTISLALSGVLADKLISLRLLSTTAVRKLFQCTAFLGIAVMIVIPGYLNCDQEASVNVCLCVAMLFEALGQTAGFSSNVIDIAPRYASIIYGFSNSMATVPGMVAPIMVAALTPNGTLLEWRVVFFITCICSLIGAVLFGGFASSEPAPWADEVHEIHVSIDSEKVPMEIIVDSDEKTSSKNSVKHVNFKVCDKLIDKNCDIPVDHL